MFEEGIQKALTFDGITVAVFENMICCVELFTAWAISLITSSRLEFR